MGMFYEQQVGDLVKMDGIINQIVYHITLERHTIPSGQRLMGQNCVLQQYKNSKNMSKLCTNYLQTKEDAQVITKKNYDNFNHQMIPLSIFCGKNQTGNTETDV